MGGLISTGFQTIALHWDGTSWTPFPFPQPDAAVINLKSLSGTATDDLWAVGSDDTPGVVAKSARSYHWDGSSWSKVRVGLTGYSYLSAVVAIAPDDV